MVQLSYNLKSKKKEEKGCKYFQEPDGIPTNNRLDSMKG